MTRRCPPNHLRPTAVAISLGMAAAGGLGLSTAPAAEDRASPGAQALEERFVLGPTAADDLGFRVVWQTGSLVSLGATAQHMSASSDSAWFADSAGSIVRLRRDNGETVWRASTNPGIERVTAIEHLPSGARDHVFVVTDLNSVTLDAATGTMVRKSSFSHLPSQEPAVFGPSLVYGSHTGLCCWFQYGNGFNWRACSLGGNIVAPVSVAGPMVLVGSTSGAIYALDAATAEILWTRRLAAGVEAKIASDERSCFVAAVDQSVWAFDLSNGRVLWQHFTSSPLRNPPSRVGDGLYVQVPGEGLVSLNPAPKDRPDGELRWRSDVPGDVLAASGSRVYAWDQRSKTMTLLDAASGRVIHGTRIPGAVEARFTSPNGGDLMLMSANGRVECLAPIAPANPGAASASASASPSR